MKKVCSFCKVSKEHAPDGKTTRGLDAFVDSTGRRWKHDTCPDCYNTKQRALNKAARDRVKKPKVKTKTRQCGICKKTLPADRYFNHKECIARRDSNYHDIFSEYELHV